MAELSRVRFRERQPLTAADLDAEQAHRLALRRRHNAGQHRWGIAAGLELAEDDRGLIVGPGVALDGFGRELVLPGPILVGFDALGRVGGPGVPIAVSLLYGREAAGRDRWREICRLRLTAGSPPEPPAFDPSRTPPDHPAAEWPVPLGIATLRDPAPGIDLNLESRVHTGLVGEEVLDPAGRMRLAFSRAEGRERLALGIRGGRGGEETVERLALERLPEPRPARPRPGECPPRVSGRPALAWKATVRADARVSGMRIEAPADGGPRGVGFGTALPAPKEPAPWSLYRTAADPAGTHPEELRFEIGHPGDKGEPSAHRFVLPCLTATADRTVTVHGDLIVNGLLVQGPVPADPDNPAFASAVAGAWLKGIKAALSLDARFDGQVSAPPTAEVTRSTNYTVALTNTGHAELSTFSLTERITIGTETRSRDFMENLTLPAGQTLSLTRLSQAFFRVGTATLSITVRATGPAGNELQKEFQTTVEVFPIVG